MDHRSYTRNLSSCEINGGKKIRPVTRSIRSRPLPKEKVIVLKRHYFIDFQRVSGKPV